MSFRNRKSTKKMGGVATAVANNLKQHWSKVSEGENDDEFLITRLDHVYPPIIVINVYGGQESRMTRKEVLDSWLRLKREIEATLNRKEGIVLIGDFNRSIGNDHLGIKGNTNKITYGGEHLREMLKENKMVLVNGLELTQGGPWTWESRADPNKKSCLDLVMVSEDLIPYVSSLLVDSKREYAPCRVTNRKKGPSKSSQEAGRKGPLDLV